MHGRPDGRCPRDDASAEPGCGGLDRVQRTQRPSAHAPSAPSAPITTPAKPSPAPRRLPLAGDMIVLDPGHDGGNATHPAIINQLVNVITEQKACDTVGAETDAGYPEHAFTFDVAIRLAGLLRMDGATVVLTRQTDSGVGPCVTERRPSATVPTPTRRSRSTRMAGRRGDRGSRSSNRPGARLHEQDHRPVSAAWARHQERISDPHRRALF